MKFLLIAKPKPLPASISRKSYSCLAEQALVLLQKLWEEGKLLSLSELSEGGTATVILSDSLEALQDGLKHYPLYNFFNWQVEPLTDASLFQLFRQ